MLASPAKLAYRSAMTWLDTSLDDIKRPDGHFDLREKIRKKEKSAGTL